jgi:WhiB family redox-sensing transcriptional regulator
MGMHHSNDGAIHLDAEYASRHAALHGFPEPPAWMGDALCAQTDPEAFFPEKGGSTREAKAICRSCAVQAECLDWALDHDERFGIWGGLSERERRRIRNPRPCVTCGEPTRHGSRFCTDHKPSQRDPGTGLQARVRAWALGQGIPVNDRGNIAHALVNQYLASQNEIAS